MTLFLKHGRVVNSMGDEVKARISRGSVEITGETESILIDIEVIQAIIDAHKTHFANAPKVITL